MALKNILSVLSLLNRHFPQLEQRISESAVLSHWDRVVGPHIAKHSRPLRLQDQTLFVEVTHPVWKTELLHRKHQLLQKLNETASAAHASQIDPLPQITDLHFVDPYVKKRAVPLPSKPKSRKEGPR